MNKHVLLRNINHTFVLVPIYENHFLLIIWIMFSYLAPWYWSYLWLSLMGIYQRKVFRFVNILNEVPLVPKKACHRLPVRTVTFLPELHWVFVHFNQLQNVMVFKEVFSPTLRDNCSQIVGKFTDVVREIQISYNLE